MTTLSPEIEAKILAKLEELTQDYDGWRYYSDPAYCSYESFSRGQVSLRKTQLGANQCFRLHTQNPSPEFPQPSQEALGQVFDKLVDLAQKDAIDQILNS